ncbi:hypothetical protein STFE110948_02550 [Streptobacillus felis]|uniref:hypothetical protein n=1 Tax=Streptobacillus felis TaxID=1384509 RepID=UPI00083493DD|nr:hypothetical protein [Streptobacillus felis]
MEKKFELYGYKSKVESENAVTGMKRIKTEIGLLEEIKSFSNDLLEKPIEIRRLNENVRFFRWSCGVGYDVIDTDLLGGYSDGSMKRVFESYRDYKKTHSEVDLNRLENYIDDFNEYHPNDKISKEYIERENKIINDYKKWDKKENKDMDMER